ncbi:MAG: crossover junction endodeoxyribonuclease RuvC [Alphaproteobacteria bacterium]|nr:crossover junction endodeoxyribonuclease RuvC [Alphaproteobacteria bacterium]
MRRIIGIDPGLNSTGWGIIDVKGSALQFIACGTISAKDTSQTMAERVLILSEGLKKAIAEFSPTEAAMEETFATQNGQSTLKLGQARGALMLTLAQANLTVGEYAARSVKKAIVGTGTADKNQITQMVGILLPASKEAMKKEKHDASDALAIAICHANHSQHRSAA